MLQWFSDSLNSLNSVKVLLYFGKTPMSCKTQMTSVTDSVLPRHRGCHPRGGGINLLFGKIFAEKLHENERNWTEMGAHPMEMKMEYMKFGTFQQYFGIHCCPTPVTDAIQDLVKGPLKCLPLLPLLHAWSCHQSVRVSYWIHWQIQDFPGCANSQWGCQHIILQIFCQAPISEIHYWILPN